MKSILYTAAGALLILSSCSSAYKTARTPDDVYYSPRTERTYASSGNQQQDQSRTAVAAANEEDGSYVTYDDEEQGDYAKRIDRFRNNYNGSYYADGTPNVYVNNYYGGGFGYSPYSYWGGGFGYPAYYGSGLSISLGLGWGWGGGGFGYSPWYSPWAYNPWYSPWYSPWGPHYYAGGWGGWGGYGHYYPGGGYYYAPNRGYRSRSGFGGTNYVNGNPRVIGNNNTGGRTSGDYRPRRIFRDSYSGGNSDGNSGGRTYQPRRIFRSSGETPTVRPGGNSGGSYTPRRVFQSAPQQSQPSREIRSAPSRNFSAPSYSPPSNNGGGSSGGGGGRTFRSRN